MTKLFAIALALASCCTLAWADEATGKRADAPSMRFEWHPDQSADCTDCVSWIYAAGPIGERTPKDFERFIAANDVRGATMVLNSPGGSVSGAIALGRQIRALDLKDRKSVV